ncbi:MULTISPECIES: GGDEF domain-containing protein [unclassified Pseudomonas]|uniref:GGDEF domain-containing protein n=1 Tax=unclassified Pseudomonas TaxID=196821 RepID=UPI000D39D1DC|nr:MULTISPECIES: GGDEF domain-containing protein [unclassified Pseudomonas]RAU47498.1 GGDEF domain-containing protein [Pseudomonas sp. RIT 409]RAU51827.1 GGDEF domain-containing protein [Pseudomonas sp. RIT 412]
MSFPPPTNAIDFDSARLQRLGLVSVNSTVQPPLDEEQLRRKLALQLQSSLEADKILSMFFDSVQPLIPLGALIYQHGDTDLRLELGERGRHSASYRMSFEGEPLGEFGFQRDRRFNEPELAQLESLLGSLLYPLRNALLYRHASLSALRDPLTGAGNRIAMEQSLTREIEIARRQQQPLSVLMLDIDHFKTINDTYGHATGDGVLKVVTRTIKDRLRNIDQVFRFGGEEFLIVLTNTGRESAALVGERLRHAALQLTLSVEGSPIELTVSLGCSTLLPGESPDSLLRRADSALYAAKRQGRNRLEMAG